MADFNEFWKSKWTENYEGRGDCENLINETKGYTVKNKKINYLPWAVVDRVFKFQGGTFEVLKFGDSTVEKDSMHIRDEISSDGVVTEKFANSYFVNIRVNWFGQTYIERYPLLGQTNNSLTTWNQADINKAIQRGRVKAIANVSGIGYKLFEDGDLQFETEDEAKAKLIEEVKKSAKVSKPVSKTTGKPKAKADIKIPKEAVGKIKIPNVVKPTPAKEVIVKEEPKKVAKETETKEVVKKDTASIPREDKEDFIKKCFLENRKEKTALIKPYLLKKKVAKIQELPDEDLNELYAIVK